jgi:hypothetical protein
MFALLGFFGRFLTIFGDYFLRAISAGLFCAQIFCALFLAFYFVR